MPLTHFCGEASIVIMCELIFSPITRPSGDKRWHLQMICVLQLNSSVDYFKKYIKT